MVQWFNASMVQWFNASMVQWFNDLMIFKNYYPTTRPLTTRTTRPGYFSSML